MTKTQAAPKTAEKIIDFPAEGTDERAEKEHAYKPDEDQIAVELAAALQGRAAFFYGWWRVYEDGVWTQRDNTEMRRYIRREVRDYRRKGIRVTNALIGGLLNLLEDDLYIPDRVIMAAHAEHRRYVPLRNGVFNLDTFELEPHRADLYFLFRLDFDFDEDADCPYFMRYLRSSLVLPGTRETDQRLVTLAIEALAYSMTARTDLKSSFWLVGEKDSGKSTFIALIKALMGDLYGTIDLTQLGSNRFLLSGIVGKRVIAFTEASGSSMLPDALYKALTGGSDEIFADVKNRDPITFRPAAKVWWAMNNMPRVNDRSGATIRRIIIIPFNRTIPENERDYQLEQRLMDERAGIFNQMITHLKRIQRAGGFTRVDQVEERRADYALENDIEQQYALDRWERHESYKMTGSELYADYKSWCEQFGYRAKSMQQTTPEWIRLGLVKGKSSNVIYQGARIKSNKTAIDSL